MIQNANYSGRNDILNVMATGTASGQVVSIMDGAENTPIKNLTIDFGPYQSGSGDPNIDNIRKIHGINNLALFQASSKNILGGLALAKRIKAAVPEAVIDETNKTISFKSNDTVTSIVGSGLFKPNTQYTFILKYSTTGSVGLNLKISFTDSTDQSFSATEVGVVETKAFVSSKNRSILNFRKYNSSGTTTLYYEECGIFEGNHTVDYFEPYVGNYYPIIFPSEAGDGGTVYGGILSTNSNGEWILTVTHHSCELNADNIIASNFGSNETCYGSNFELPIDAVPSLTSGGSAGAFTTIGSRNYGTYYQTLNRATSILNTHSEYDSIDVVSGSGKSVFLYIRSSDNLSLESFLEKIAGVQIYYKLATPQSFVLTAPQVKTLLGTNTFLVNWHRDCFNQNLVHYKDINTILKSLEERISALENA